MARAIIEKRGRWAAPPPPQASGRRVFLALWRRGVASVETSNSTTMSDAVASAAESLVVKMGGGMEAEDRLELDVPTDIDGASVDEDIDVPLASIGLQGLLAIRDDGKTGVVLPGEVVQRSLFHGRKLDVKAMGSLLAARAGISERELTTMRVYRFRADVHVESPGHDTALPVFRGMVEPPTEVAPDALLAAVRRGAEYLTRIMKPSGRYVYMYYPADDRDDPSYGWLRHSGTTYALLEAYEEFGTSVYLEKAELALRYLGANLLSDVPSQGKYVIDTSDEEQQKVGGAALALLAFTEHAVVLANPDRLHDLETMRALARFIIKQQYQDGHFRSNADVARETGQSLKREPIYYPGEAVLALMRLYAIDPRAAYLDSARRGADWVVHVRDEYVSEDNQEHDHWISYAFNELYRVTHDDAYLNHAYKIARAIQKKQRAVSAAPERDFVGTFYDGQTTPASTRVEAYDADIALSRFAGKSESWLAGPAKEAARSILGQQYDSSNEYWLKNPGKADGGVRESLFVGHVRIDYVQHAMSAWLHLARLLRDPMALSPARAPEAVPSPGAALH